MAGTAPRRLNQEVLGLVRRYIRTVERAGIPVQEALIFGSYARGTPHQWSDIDVAVVSTRFGHNPHDERVQLMKLCRDISTAIEPHPFHPDDLNDRWSTLAQEVKKYGIRLE